MHHRVWQAAEVGDVPACHEKMKLLSAEKDLERE
jgi:hypothetical protein